MATRLYFIVGDLLSNTLLGGIVGVACTAIFGEAWPMIPAMLLGMVLGMVIAVPVQLVCHFFFGAFEVMLPMMLTGMAAGMVVSMAASISRLSLQGGTLLGIAAGVAILGFTYTANALLTREVQQWTE